MRITAQLIDAVKESHLWAESYERDLRDVLSLQSEIAQSIAREIRIKLTPQERAQLSEARPVDPDAYEAYLKGRYYWNKRSGDSLSKGAECFRQAIERDPNYAAAYAGLADCASSAGWFGFLSPDEAFGKGRLIAQKALEIDRSLGEAHASLGWALTHYDYDFAAAEREHERAIELSPRYATAHQWFALLLIPLGRFEEAFAELKRAMRLDPLSPIIQTSLAWAYLWAHRYEEAIEQAKRTVDLDANFPACLVCTWRSQHAERRNRVRDRSSSKGSRPFCRWERLRHRAWLGFCQGRQKKRSADNSRPVIARTRIGEICHGHPNRNHLCRIARQGRSPSLAGEGIRGTFRLDGVPQDGHSIRSAAFRSEILRFNAADEFP